MLTPYKHDTGKPPRYYQQVAIDRAVDAVLAGKQRMLLTMATGTGKTTVAFQICWRLWNARWNRTGEYRKPRILFLADRNKLIDDPKDKDFAPFGDARNKIEGGKVVTSREIYFAIYQAIAKDENRPGFTDFVAGLTSSYHGNFALRASSSAKKARAFLSSDRLRRTSGNRRKNAAPRYGCSSNAVSEESNQNDSTSTIGRE